MSTHNEVTKLIKSIIEHTSSFMHQNPKRTINGYVIKAIDTILVYLQ